MPRPSPLIYIDGDRPETLFCRRCLCTLIVPGRIDEDYDARTERAITQHEKANRYSHPITGV